MPPTQRTGSRPANGGRGTSGRGTGTGGGSGGGGGNGGSRARSTGSTASGHANPALGQPGSQPIGAGATWNPGQRSGGGDGGRRDHPVLRYAGINSQVVLRLWAATVAEHHLVGSQGVAEATSYHRKVMKRSKRLPAGFSRTGWDLKLKLAARKWEAAERKAAQGATGYAKVAQAAANAALQKSRIDPSEYRPET